MNETDSELLERYTRQRAEDAFAEIVRRHLDLVHSAAFRQVRSPQLAEEVAQSVFTDLSRDARRLAPDTILTAWLYRVTRRTAIDVVRREARRQLREQIATEMNAMNATAADWTHIEPILDDAMHALDETDRTAVLLRYFENKSLREVGQTLGTSDDAAQKRVSRAVERLREFFAKHGVAVGSSGLVVAISANAVQAAPLGLAVTIESASVLVRTTFTSATTKTLAMTTMQKTLISGALLAAVGTGIYEAHQASTARAETRAFRQERAALGEQLQLLTRERDDAERQLAGLRSDIERQTLASAELLKLRGQVARLQVERADMERLWKQNTNNALAGGEPKPSFKHRYLARSTWKNAGQATAFKALETFLWAWTSRNEAALAQVSARDTNGEPIGLTGMSTSFQDRLMGAQVLQNQFESKELDATTVTMVYEAKQSMEDQNGQPYEGISHGLLRLRFEKSNEEWRFAGQDKLLRYIGP